MQTYFHGFALSQDAEGVPITETNDFAGECFADRDHRGGRLLWRNLLPRGDRGRCLCHLARLSPSAIRIVWTLGALSQIATNI